MTIIECIVSTADRFSGAATVIGAVVGMGGYFYYQWQRCNKKKRMVAYLKKRREVAPTECGGRKGRHTAAHLSRRFGFTPDEIYTMAKKSRSHIRCEDNPTGKTWYWYCD